MIRDIRVDDINLIAAMLYELHGESPRYNQVAPDEPHVRKSLTALIGSPAFIGLIDHDLRGVMFGVATNTWFDSELTAAEMLLYILPEYRGGLLAPRLIKAFESDARRLGCTRVRAGTSTLVNTEQTLRLYERLGYSREGHTVTKRLN